MENSQQHINSLLAEIDQLKGKLYEADAVIEAIREGGVDALVLSKEGQPHIYSIESADYTYRILIEKFGEGALSISEDGLILYCNDYFSKLIGFPANKITGTYFSSYFDDPAAFSKFFKKRKSRTVKEELVLKGALKKLHVYVSLTDLTPTVPAIGVVVTDLTEKRKHEEDLIKYQKKLEIKVNQLNLTNTNLEQFIHVISHDLKEPLRKILTYTSHLNTTSSELLGAKDVKNLNIINSSALRLNSLVDDLVKYAFSTNMADKVEVSLDKVIGEVIDDLEIMIRETGAVITVGKLPEITGSRVQMRQLFANLISNSIKYSREKVRPEISIESETVGNELKISVSDNGIGMDNQYIGKIFTIFQRLHPRDEYSGNGIGLAICKKIMENHNGRIEVQSVPQKGSIFKIYFPLKVSKHKA